MNKYQLSELDLKKCALIINKLDRVVDCDVKEMISPTPARDNREMLFEEEEEKKVRRPPPSKTPQRQSRKSTHRQPAQCGQ